MYAPFYLEHLGLLVMPVGRNLVGKVGPKILGWSNGIRGIIGLRGSSTETCKCIGNAKDEYVREESETVCLYPHKVRLPYLYSN